ncbi:hypothetical protein K443DRAFT_671540 [Laccaria amethystina LaAM-08-1]|uniref:Uncharacterized protein n=1 Tax=Laccaria amethystina LaAM-08-1 TaxID=1095629 RepID=A0A0C9XXD5_9AGAR|nr:hypothetical protein K443DRAFT_671540 [Laccaria amethystina LaAM-08-1]
MGNLSYPGCKSEKKMTEKNARFRFTPRSFSCSNSSFSRAFPQTRDNKRLES